jgi:hypothetical protein
VEREPLSIRKFAEVCGVSHTEIGRKMTVLGIAGTPQGYQLKPGQVDRTRDWAVVTKKTV